MTAGKNISLVGKKTIFIAFPHTKFSRKRIGFGVQILMNTCHEAQEIVDQNTTNKKCWLRKVENKNHFIYKNRLIFFSKIRNLIFFNSFADSLSLKGALELIELIQKAKTLESKKYVFQKSKTIMLKYGKKSTQTFHHEILNRMFFDFLMHFFLIKFYQHPNRPEISRISRNALSGNIARTPEFWFGRDLGRKLDFSRARAS